MTKEMEIYAFRKQLLRQLPQRLNENFRLSFNIIEDVEKDMPERIEDDAEVERRFVIYKYRELLNQAIFTEQSIYATGAEEDSYDLHSPVDFPLPPYDEVPLSPGTDEIRLLQLLPGNYIDPIHCNLFQVDSVSLYEYEALSYVWGSTENTQVIYVNDWEMGITKSLEAALRSLRYQNTPRLLWADAICLDQSSNAEKSSQVRKMGDIYEAAKRVLVFLGPKSSATGAIFDFFETGYFQLPDLGQNNRQGELAGLEPAAYLIEHHLPLLKSFMGLLFRPWFSRAWVRQEYIRATEVPVLYCGRRHIDFPKDAFNLLCEAVFHLPTILTQPMSVVLPACSFHEVYARAVSVFQTMNSANQYPQRVDAWLFNEGVNGCKASDPKDLIFSICGLFDSTAGSILKADYFQTVEDTFLRASAWILMMEQSPRILIQYPPMNGEGIPSWVLDFTKARPTSKHSEFAATSETNTIILPGDREDDKEAREEEISGDGKGNVTTGGNYGHTNSPLPGDLVRENEENIDYKGLGNHKGEIDREAEQHKSCLGEAGTMDTLQKREQKSHQMEEDCYHSKSQEHIEEEPDKRCEEEPEVSETPTIYCSIYQQVLSMPGIEFDTIEHIYDISSKSRLDAARQLWQLEKLFLFDGRTDNRKESSGIMSLHRQAYILQWAVKIPMNHKIIRLIPQSEHYLEFLDAELEEYVEQLDTELLEDLLGALLFDFEALDSELRSQPLPSSDNIFGHDHSLSNGRSLRVPQYSNLRAHVLTSDECQNTLLCEHLRHIATEVLPSLLQSPEPPWSPRRDSFASQTTESDTSEYSSTPMLHSLPRTHLDLLQGWENEREDIFSQLFRSCCFFRTKQGFPGLGAFGLKGLQIGDVVIMLNGIPMPMILRKHHEEHHWRLVGPAVVRGIMNGELIELNREGVLDGKMFKIK
ncbi:hypothetical protein CC78DRAFT_568202 [Lojkania enalia]|uniref:Heterokaryon incompatibility domain-containing protein n=1 Tax=Lojkania enalia TaxID=147567 RepID=A0A9P4K811_9PLEO|nr:hypothetical protein CC78DRAFT_568202 [Didymosphaeria enalia]